MRNSFQKRLHAPKGRHLEPPICGGSQWRPPGWRLLKTAPGSGSEPLMCSPPEVIFRERQLWESPRPGRSWSHPMESDQAYPTIRATKDAEKTALHMSGSGAASQSREPFSGAATPGAPLGAATDWRLQVPPLGSMEPFLEAILHDYIRRTRKENVFRAFTDS